MSALLCAARCAAVPSCNCRCSCTHGPQDGEAEARGREVLFDLNLGVHVVHLGPEEVDVADREEDDVLELRARRLGRVDHHLALLRLGRDAALGREKVVRQEDERLGARLLDGAVHVGAHDVVSDDGPDVALLQLGRAGRVARRAVHLEAARLEAVRHAAAQLARRAEHEHLGRHSCLGWSVGGGPLMGLRVGREASAVSARGGGQVAVLVGDLMGARRAALRCNAVVVARVALGWIRMRNHPGALLAPPFGGRCDAI